MQHEYNVLKFIKADVCTTVHPIRTNVLRGGYCLDDNLLQNAVSLQSLRNQEKNMLDCIIVGSGIAGISAALTLKANGKNFIET